MNNKIIGIVLLIVGTALAVWGYDVYNSAGAQLERTFSGAPPAEAWIGLVGGAICIVLGILRLK